MELFSEIYGSYYKAVAKVLDEAGKKPLSLDEIKAIISEAAFTESPFYIVPKLTGGDWPLLKKTGLSYTTSMSVLQNKPLTALQKSWLKSILHDPRIFLFLSDDEVKLLDHHLGDTPPLYNHDDFYIYDSAKDGDDYTSPEYRRNFKVILDAINKNMTLYMRYTGKRNRTTRGYFLPHKMEYSMKDDKFRLLCTGNSRRGTKEYVFNLSRIQKVNQVQPSENILSNSKDDSNLRWDNDEAFQNNDDLSNRQFHIVKFEITKERNALERVMVQFANYKKSTKYNEQENKYTCTMRYNAMDETEVLIMLLSFGPTIKITGPERFLGQFKERIKMQIQNEQV